MAIDIRPAQAGDKDAVLAFTAHTWDWGDYIEHAWDDWLVQPNSELSVAEIDGAVVGMTMTVLLSSGDGWMQGLRVHPEAGRQGVARLLTAHQINLLRQWGATAARLAVHCRNLPSQTHVAQAGFRRMTTFDVLECAAAAGAGSTPDPLQILSPAGAREAFRQLTGWPAFRATAGLWANHWTWEKLTEEALAAQASAGNLVGLAGNGEAWAALAILLPGDDTLYAGYVDGAPAAVERLARAVATRAGQAGKERAAGMLPPLAAINDAFCRAGYGGEHGGMYIYDMALHS